MISSFFSRIVILVFGTLFPAYYSYKAVRTKNVKEYVKWMMYWIVFAFFTCAETITDIFFSFWFPFYYEIKILVVLWLLSPATNGSSILYRKFVHPWLIAKESEIDECIEKAKQQGYTTMVELGTKGVNYATNVIMQTALKGGGGLVSHLKRSYSTSEIGEDTADFNRNVRRDLPMDENDASSCTEENQGQHTRNHRARSSSESFTEFPSNRSTSKTKSVEISGVDFLDTSDNSVVAPIIVRRRSPRNLDSKNYRGNMSSRMSESCTQLNMNNIRSGNVSSYATLPRAGSKRNAVKKRQQ